jgi:hypothetical protein
MATAMEYGPAATAYVEVCQSSSHGRQLHELEIFEKASQELWADIRNRLHCIRGLEADWDGDGAIAPDAGLVDAAEKLTRVLQTAPGLSAPNRVTAMPNGSISFEWELAGGKVEVEIETEGSATVSFIAPGAEVAELWTCRLPELHRRLMTVYAT